MSLYRDPQDDQQDDGPIHSNLPLPAEAIDGGQGASAYSGPNDDSFPTGNADWMTQAPEAAGAAPFSTTPENAAPRPTQPMAKSEIPTVGDSPSEASQKDPDSAESQPS